MKNYLLLLTLIATFSFTSCKEDEIKPEPTKAEMLVGKNWKMIAQTSTTTTVNQDPAVRDDYANYDNCQKDNIMIFHPDNNFIYDEGGIKCSSSSSQIQDGTWTFANSEAKLLVTGKNINLEADIADLTSEKMILKTKKSYNVGIQGYYVDIITTYVPQ
jgi:hypothetical protein